MNLQEDTQRYERVVEAARIYGANSLWCVAHDRPLAVTVDALSLTVLLNSWQVHGLKREAHRLGICSAWLELPQAQACKLELSHPERMAL